ncbi:predicted protein [Scheffersomyces stipitis CBS 6054]|uniref:Uncharacterized protein n=1 Tax=Scheffersomyces stipitis (strain ATCC 58785 / CBS 6054 / NBRC 10063 / NRRL Y-11545) TaxID=322104 RepID=A3LUM5_PICST|nr:predicted protein [Scheffersomyces stipitis CBS 6054]ABN66263.2 predicted protein [Scheffersomyces stipitis CBS 6054]
MEFDPLSLFTPEPSSEIEENFTVAASVPDFSEPSHSIPDYEEIDDSHLQPLHILDLPLLQLKPPSSVLITILRLFSPDEVFNFDPSESRSEDSIEVDIEEVFQAKNLESHTVVKALGWLKINCPRFDCLKKLAYIPHLSESLRRNYEPEYNSYFTRIVSNDLSWIEQEDEIALIHKQASLRISENCGRTAQPEIIRKINLPNLSPLLKDGRKYIELKEPSLTSDNLGLKTWGSSLILANRLINKDEKGYLVGEVLELGSGTGLVGLVCSLIGHKTYLTDLAEIVPNLQVNVDLNDINAEVHELNWCDPNSFVSKYGEKKFKTIVVSDPVYSSNHPYWVVNMITKFLDNSSNSRVLIQIPLRPKFESDRALLWNLMKDHFVELEHVVEDGYDDFGKMKFCFKMFIRKDSHS